MKNLNDRLAEISSLTIPIRGTSNWDRLSLHITRFTSGRRLADYYGDAAVTDEQKHALFDEIERVIKGALWDECPPVPSGQAKQDRPSPLPARVVPVAPVVPVAATATVTVPADAPPSVPDPMAALAAALLPYLLKQLPQQSPPEVAPSAPSLDEDDVKKVVRAELALVFTAIAKGITS